MAIHRSFPTWQRPWPNCLAVRRVGSSTYCSIRGAVQRMESRSCGVGGDSGDLLLWRRGGDNVVRRISLLVYGLSMVACFTASAPVPLRLGAPRTGSRSSTGSITSGSTCSSPAATPASPPTCLGCLPW